MQSAAYDFSGKTALVIGGTAGIGLAAVKRFGAADANVVIAGLGSPESQDVVSEIGERKALFVETDVASEPAMIALMRKATDRFGRIDIAVNNAGVAISGPIQNSTSEDFDRVISVNLRGVWLGMKHQVLHMLEHGGGSIVNTSSTAGLVSIPFTAIYSASKHAVIGMTKAAAIELGASKIRINAIAPGGVKTALFDAGSRGNPAAEGMFAQRVPMGRLAAPDEIAEGILWLASDSARYVTGHTLVVDGGYSLV